MKRTVKNGYGHLCLREESKTIKRPEEDRQNRQRPPMSEGEEESKKTKRPEEDSQNRLRSPIS